jgi:hypothetical protein
MNAEQYRNLLQELARLGGLSDAARLVDEGHVRVGDTNVLLERDPDHSHIVQARVHLGNLGDDKAAQARALLRANYSCSYAGDRVFSLYPMTDEAVVTMKLRLDPAMSAQELWERLSSVSRMGASPWKELAVAKEQP